MPAVANGFGAQTWPDEFMPDTVKYLADTMAVDNTRVFQSVHTEEEHLRFPVNADWFVTVFLQDYPASNYQIGGGNQNTQILSKLITRLFLRVEADIENKSAQYLQDEAQGVYKVLNAVISALQTYPGPVIEDQDLYAFCHPLLLKPGFQIKYKSGGQDTRWGVCEISWDLSFVARLGNPYPS